MYFLHVIAVGPLLAAIALAGFPSPHQDVSWIDVPGKPGVHISYKRTFICETRASSFAGYVHLDSSQLGYVEPTGTAYNVSMFFWYFEARNNPRQAPTSIYLAGGPGASSMHGAAQSGGPCRVLRDANSTESNPWSWNNNVNMLYIDQPVGAGFSYNALVNSTKDLLATNSISAGVTPFDQYGEDIPPENTTFLYGTFPSQSPSMTANNSVNAARTLWHFSQAWFSSFPEHNTSDGRVSLWGISYGGYWVPVAAKYMLEQNAKIESGEVKGKVLKLDTTGWINGCTDSLVQAFGYPELIYNNTYGLTIGTPRLYGEVMQNITKPGGCLDLTQQCRDLGNAYDPENYGVNVTVNAACVKAFDYCFRHVMGGGYDIISKRSDFDIAHFKPEPYPPSYLTGFFNRAWVQRALGVPVNFTSDALAVQAGTFLTTGDPARIAGSKTMSFLLESGIKVALVYGDRDYRCPWTGGERLSLQTNWSSAEAFRSAGYQYIELDGLTDAGCHGGDDCHAQRGGLVRQYGNLSFSRVFQAGHDVASYQPATALSIFERVMFDKDISTGTVSTVGRYKTEGPNDTLWRRDDLPEPPPAGENCNLYSVVSSCTIEQYLALANGTAEVENFRVVKPAGGTRGSLLDYLSSQRPPVNIEDRPRLVGAYHDML